METRPCPACGAETGARYRLCGQCGTGLGAGHAPEAIRRFVTIVTSDLKGSTALGEKLDPETLRELLGHYFDEMRVVFESNGGRIEKIIGDAIVAVFGPSDDPADDAHRGLEAAAESQRALARLNGRFEATWGIRLVVRTGIASGDVVFGERGQSQQVLSGPAITTATAMEQNAPPLEVLVAHPTVDLLAGRLEVEPMGHVTPKGTDWVVPSFRLVSVGERRADPPPAGADAEGVRRCAACGEANPETFQVCGMCGNALVRAAIAADTRKTVTIVFADPKPTTIDGSAPPADAISHVMPPYFEAMKAALERHGGTVEKFIGDAVMAVFGLPVRHEDDAIRAIRAAAEMQAALPDLNERSRAAWGLELRNHIGVNSGEVIAGDASLGQRLVTGDAVNTAARLEQAAGAAEIILGDLTYRLARDQVEVEPIPPLRLKGKAEPVPAYRVVRVNARSAERAATSTRFVGREQELRELEEALLEALATRTCRLAAVIGEAGVGKSRLVREFAASASQGDRAEVVRGRCLPYGDGVTFWPIGEIVRNCAGIVDEDPPETAEAKIAAVSRRADGVADDATAVAERVASAIGLTTKVFQKDELFWGIRRLLEAMATRGPVVAIVDDIHVAAPTFLELLDHLLDTVRGTPILLLATARHELLEIHPGWSGDHEPQQITLEPLGAAQANAILDELLAGLEPAIRERIVEAAEGNPLYVEQIASMLVETGALRQEARRWVATSSSDTLAIPPTVQALVAARLDALPRGERAVVDPASVIGYSFPSEALVELVEGDVRAVVHHQLKSLGSKQIVRRTSDDGDFFRFGHNVIKDTAYGSLLKRMRARLHEQFVAWAEPVNRERGRELEFEEILGYHLEQAFRYRTELGPLDDDVRALGQRAAEKLANAGQRALARADMSSASALLLRSAALLDSSDPWRIELLADAAEALQELGRHERAGELLDEARTVAVELGDRRLEARAVLGRLMNQYDTDPSLDLTVALDETGRAMDALATAGDEGGLARAWRMRTTLTAGAGRIEEATDAAQRWAEHGRRAGEDRLARSGAINLAFLALLGPSPVDELLPFCERMLDEVRGHRKSEAAISGTISLLLAMQGSFGRARELYKRGQQMLAELGPSLTASSTSTESGRVELLAGDALAAERELRRDWDALGEMGETALRPTIGAFLAEALYQQGRLADAAAVTAAVRALAAEDDVVTQMLWRCVGAKLAALEGDADGASGLAEEALGLARAAEVPALTAGVLVDVGEVHVLLGRPESAGPPWREALEFYERKGDLVSAARLRDRVPVAISSPSA